MTQDKDREAFEVWWNPFNLPEQASDSLIKMYSKKAWKAALAYERANAPKLTEAEAVELACEAFTKPENDGDEWSDTTDIEAIKFHVTSKPLVRKSMLKALKAAGMSFEEEV